MIAFALGIATMYLIVGVMYALHGVAIGYPFSWRTVVLWIAR